MALCFDWKIESSEALAAAIPPAASKTAEIACLSCIFALFYV